MTQTARRWPSSLPVPPGKMSYEEFLDWATDIPAEWVDGEVELRHLRIDPATGKVSLSVSEKHSKIVVFLVALLQFFVEAFDAGRIYADQFQMKLGPNLPGREPDVL